MIANSRCIACILSKQERKIRKNSDEQKKKEYIHKVLKILYEYGTKECAPMVEKRIKDIYKEYYEEDVDYVALKHRYNQYMLEKEEEIRAHIQKNNDIETCIKYVCAGNYIDFGVANKIDDQLLQGLLDKVNELKISKKEVAYLEDEIAHAKTLLYITDNCGEIVLDKIFIEELQNKYKNLQITAMVRGGIASNDATMEDAEEIVQDIMVWLWENREYQVVEISLRSYLFKSVKNKCLALIDKNQTKRRFCEHMLATEMQGVFEDPDFYIAEELMNQIEKTVSQMPETYRVAFEMSRYQDMTYKEIAEELDVSAKVVDYRIQQALKILRTELKDYLPLITVIFPYFLTK